MTTRQQILIDYLKAHKGYTKQEDILRDLSTLYGVCAGPTAHDSTPRLALTGDIRTIRELGAAAIISNRNGIKLGTKDENHIYHRKRLMTIKRHLAKEYATIKLLGLENQLDVDGKIRDIVEGSADV